MTSDIPMHLFSQLSDKHPGNITHAGACKDRDNVEYLRAPLPAQRRTRHRRFGSGSIKRIKIVYGKNGHKKNRYLQRFPFDVVEMRGVEPLSENKLKGFSPSAACGLTFPPASTQQAGSRFQ
jgi:hypothetical protein